MHGIDPHWLSYDAKWFIKKTFLKDIQEVFIWHLAFKAWGWVFLGLTENTAS